MKRVFLAAIVVVALAALILVLPPRFSGTPDEAACTLEAKICPDGSAVGRVGPLCEFSKCPGEDEGDEGGGHEATAPAESSGGVCEARDAATLKSCAERVNKGEADDIEIVSVIACGGERGCAVALQGIRRPVSIYGRKNSGVGIRRQNTYDYQLVTVDNSEGVRIRDLSFDENEHQPCTPVSDPANCKGTIFISNSRDIVIDNVTISHSKQEAVVAYNSKGVVVTNSEFVNAYLFGLTLSNDLGKGLVSARVEDNLFKDIKSNALVLWQTQAAAAEPITVKGNTFVNNHRENVYYLCGPGGQSGNEPCPGGQIYIANDVANVKIENNVVKDGGSAVGTGGIEFASRNVRNVDIIGNEIYNNNMWGIYINPAPQNVGDILISKNKVYQNGLLPQYAGVNISIPHAASVIESGNCFTASCTP